MRQFGIRVSPEYPASSVIIIIIIIFLRIERKTRRDVHDDPDSTFDAQELARDSHFPRRVFLLISFAALGVLATMAKR